MKRTEKLQSILDKPHFVTIEDEKIYTHEHVIAAWNAAIDEASEAVRTKDEKCGVYNGETIETWSETVIDTQSILNLKL